VAFFYFYIMQRLVKSFGYALNGIVLVLKKEANFKIHILAAVVVITAGFIFNIDFTEWIAVTICIVLVLSLELINSSIEHMLDVLSPKYNKKVKFSKDIAAGSVFIAAVGAIVVAGIIFIPKIINYTF